MKYLFNAIEKWRTGRKKVAAEMAVATFLAHFLFSSRQKEICRYILRRIYPSE